MGFAALSAAARRLCLALHFRFCASLHAKAKRSRFRVRYRVSGFADLRDFSLLLQCGEIPRRCCVRDVQEFLYFVVGDLW